MACIRAGIGGLSSPWRSAGLRGPSLTRTRRRFFCSHERLTGATGSTSTSSSSRGKSLGLGFGLGISLISAVVVSFTDDERVARSSNSDGANWRRHGDQDSTSVASIKQYPANRPIEDRCYMERLNNGAWWFSVFDGHGGWQCSDYASKTLSENVAKAMAHFLGKDFSHDDDGLYEDRIDRKLVTKALKSAFERTDRQYMVKVAGAFELGFGRDTRAGSCALGALVVDGVLFVGNAGDSRAVLAVNRSGYEASTASLNLGGRKQSTGAKSRVAAEADMDGWNIDEFLGQAALKDSIGEELSPEVAEALRSRLLHQIYELKQSEKTPDEVASEEAAIKAAARDEALALAAVAEDSKASSLSNAPAGNKTSSSNSSGKNPFVKAVRMLTGGSVSDDGVSSSSSGSSSGGSSGGKPGVGNEFVAIDMSNDHNCREPHEREMLERNHPNEKDVVMCRKDSPDQCYIKGKLQPTRAFGDFYLKYPEFMRNAGADSSAGRYVPPPYTPPYITASPEVQVRTLRKGVDEFLVMATDGLWDMMSSQEAIDIAGEHLRKPGGSPAEACAELTEEALNRAAKAHGITVAQLKALKPGSKRRSKHDDISVIVIDLKALVNLHYWG